MKKSDIIKIVVILIVIGFLTEPLWFGGGLQNLFQSPIQAATNVTGTAIFNGTIRTYDPLLFIQGSVPQAVVDKLNLRTDVTSMEQTTEGMLITVDSRDSVYPLAVFLRTLNVTSYSRANIVVDQNIEVQTLTGTVKTFLPNGVIQVICEPLVDADNEVPVVMTAVLRNDQIVGYQSTNILVNKSNLTLDAEIYSLNQTTYSYTIPWESRNSIGNLSDYGLATYKKVDSILFTQPLTTDQILTKKFYSSVIYIDSNTAQMESLFDDIDQLEQIFYDVDYILPSSTLTIISEDEPDLEYNHTSTYSYVILVNSSSLTENYFLVNSTNYYQIGDTLKIEIETLSLGDKVIEIKRVSLPS
ncbi:MAG: hypothetical protein ABH842_05940 [Candidatus Micrarchaeota archaeon]